jgi:orotate phosphoribosyltransferase
MSEGERMTRSMAPAEVLPALEDAGAVLAGHFRLTSGRHSDRYVQCARILEDPVLVGRLADAMVAAVGDERIDLVAAPAVGAIIIGFAVAQSMGVRFVFTEREGGAMTLRRGFSIEPGARVLVVEDVVTTGGSVAEVVDLVRAAGGVAAGVASIIDRGGPKAFDVPLRSLLELSVGSWDAETCSLCAEGRPIESPGSRALAKPPVGFDAGSG